MNILDAFKKGSVTIGCYSAEEVSSFFRELELNNIKWNSGMELFDDDGYPRIAAYKPIRPVRFDGVNAVWYSYGPHGIRLCAKGPSSSSFPIEYRENILSSNMFGTPKIKEDEDFEVSDALLDFLNEALEVKV